MIAKWAQEDVETLDNLLNNNAVSLHSCGGTKENHRIPQS